MAATTGLDVVRDDALVERARGGDRAAFDALYQRHASAAWGLAQAVTRDPLAAEAAVADGFAAALARSGPADLGAPTSSARAVLLRSTRRAAIDAVPSAAAGRSSVTSFSVEADSPRVATIRAAFNALPERWRSVLWLVDVEDTSAEDAAQVIEIAPTSVAALLDRARLGFQEQVLLTGLRHPSPQDCRRTTDRLTGYTSGALSDRDAARVRLHLDTCADCRARVAALDDLVPVLRSAPLAPPLLLAQRAAARWTTMLTRNLGPLRLGLPGGQPMPVWAQRTFAGAVAAFVALGIAGATLIAGRGQGGGRDIVSRPANGEVALGEPAPTDLDGGGLSSLPTTPPVAARPTPEADIGTSVALPRTDGANGALPVSGTPGPVVATPDEEPAAGAAQMLTVDIPGVAGITHGDECSGGQVLGTALGCAPPAGDGPITVVTPLNPAPAEEPASSSSSVSTAMPQPSRPMSMLLR